MGFSIKNASKRIDSPDTANVDSFTQLLTLKIPWAKYSGSSYLNGKLVDEINGRDGICTACIRDTSYGNGGAANIGLTVCSGSALSSSIVFPVGSIPLTNFTFASLTRYTGTTTKRILTGHQNQNYLIGHWEGLRGVMYDGSGWDTQISNNVAGNSKDWLLMCATSGGVSSTNILANGLSRGTTGIVSNATNNQLAVNTSSYGERSSFEIAHLIIWDKQLTPTEMKVVSNALANYLITGILR